MEWKGKYSYYLGTISLFAMALGIITIKHLIQHCACCSVSADLAVFHPEVNRMVQIHIYNYLGAETARRKGQGTMEHRGYQVVLVFGS